MFKRSVVVAALFTLGATATLISDANGQGRMIIQSKVVSQAEGAALAELTNSFQEALVEFFGMELPTQAYMELIPSEVPGSFSYVAPADRIFVCLQSPQVLSPIQTGNISLMRLLCDPMIRYMILDSLSSIYGLDHGFLEGLVAFVVDGTLQQAMAQLELPARELSSRSQAVYEALFRLYNTLDSQAFPIALVAARSAKVNGYEFAQVFRAALVDAAEEELIAEYIPQSWVESKVGYKITDTTKPLANLPASHRLSKYCVLGDVPIVEQTTDSGMPAKDRGAAFDELWKAIGAQYPDTEFRGVSWMGAYARYRSLASYCQNDTEFYLMIRQCMAELQDANSRVIAVEATPMWYSPEGVSVELVNEVPVIYEVREGAPEGIEKGMIVESVDGVPAMDRLARLAAYSREFEGWSNDRVRRHRAANFLLRGGPETEVTMELKGADGETRTVTAPRVFPKPPPADSPIESKLLDNNIGYVKILRFETGVREKFEQSLDAYQGIDGLVIDLRGHESGLNASVYVAECLGKLFPAEQNLGVWYGRNRQEPTQQPFRVTPRQPVFPAPICVLVDTWCFGTGEIFAWCLQNYGRAKLVGTPTAGGVFDPRPIKQIGPLQVFMGRLGFMVRGGKVIEGKGLTPDIESDMTVEAFQAGEDPVLAQAIADLKK